MRVDKSFDYFAKYYDILYKDKDYEKEVDFLEDIFRTFHNPKRILEVGCGTGNYTQILQRKGYDIIGLDVSENMIRMAKKKCNCDFLVGNALNVSIDSKFDTCIAMFAVMGYITKNSDISQALKNIHKHLEPNGLFIFDVWNGLAVLRTLPELRVKEVENEAVKVVRIAYPVLNAFDHICEVNYKLYALDKTKQTFDEFEETHIVRFYFPQEIKLFLEEARFKVLKICPFLDLNGSVDENVWNITVVGRS